MTAKVTEIKTLDEFRELINRTDVYSVFDFWATWCGPCKVISPVFGNLAEKHTSKEVEFFKVDTDAHPDIAQEVGIRAMPTFQVYKDGNKVDELVGAHPPALEALVVKVTNVK